MWYKPRLIHGQLGLKQIIGSNNSLSFSSLDGAKINRSVNNTPFEIALLRTPDRPRYTRINEKNRHPALVQKKKKRCRPAFTDAHKLSTTAYPAARVPMFLPSDSSCTILCNTHRMPRYWVCVTRLLNRSTALIPTAMQPFY